jgi:DNA-binding MarR family transcriptional regulator
MGMIEFSKGFFIFDKSWIHDNKFCQSLSHAEFRILIYLLSSGLKSSKKDERYKRGELIASLYRRNKLLVVNASQRTIADRCNADRATVYKALIKFKEFGAVIKIPDGKENGANDYYIIGFESHRKNKAGKQEYYLVDSIPIRTGQKLPDQTRNYIQRFYKGESFMQREEIWRDLFGMENNDRWGVRVAE